MQEIPSSETAVAERGHVEAALVRLLIRGRRLLIVAFHLVLIAAANYAAFALRFDGKIPLVETRLFLAMLPWLMLIRVATFTPLRLHEGLWRYTSVWDLQNIVVGVLSSTAAFYVVVRWWFDFTM